MSNNGFHNGNGSRIHNVRSLFSMFSSDLAIELGTANTLVYAKGKGIVVNEPSIVALNKNTGEVEAVGKEAKEMLGRTPGNIVAIKPMKDGVIADFKVTEKMLNYFIQKAHNRKMLVHPRIVIGVPSEITQVEKRAVMDSAYRAKASEVHLVEQAMGRQAVAHLHTLNTSVANVADLEQALGEAFAQHPAAAIIISFPGLGTVLGARILGEIGDDRTRFTRPFEATSPDCIAAGEQVLREVETWRLAARENAPRER